MPLAVVAPGEDTQGASRKRRREDEAHDAADEEDRSRRMKLEMGASSASTSVAERSRFYVKQRLVVGSTSMKLSALRKDAEARRAAMHKRHAGAGLAIDDDATHKWMIYVRAPDEHVRLLHRSAGGDALPLSAGDIALTKFISKVRFFLHPSFAPEDVVEVSAPPFQLSRYGYLPPYEGCYLLS